MDHTIAWSESIDTAAVLTQINGLGGTADERDPAFNPRLKRDWWLYGFYVQSAGLTRARLQQMSWRAIRQTEVRPITVGTAPPTDPNVMDLRGQELLIKALEGLELTASEGTVGAEQITAVGFLTDRAGQVALPDPFDVDSGAYVLRGTSTDAAVAFAWSNLATITWDQIPPDGMYQVQGLQVQSAGAIAARLVLPGRSNYRAGSLSITALGNRSHPMFFDDPRDMGTFESYSMPGVEVLANAADASHTVLMKVRRIGDSMGRALAA